MDLYNDELRAQIFSIMTIEKSWIVRIDIWNFWQKKIFTAPSP